MFKRFLPITLLSYVFVVIVNWGCTKLDTTTLGSDLIPAVDNINTFADTLDIETTQGIFNDSFRIGRSESHALGLISNDPLFGSTDARVYFQPKPNFYPFYLGTRGDTIVAIDSIVLSIAYTGAWGDTTVPQQIKVHAINDINFADSVYRRAQTIGYTATTGDLLGSASVDLRTLKNVVKFNQGKDSTTNQVRIKLSDAFRDQFFNNRDTNLPAAANKPFLSDSLFRKFYNGFAVSSTAGNALMYVNLLDVKTRLEIYVRKKNAGTGKLDSTYNSLGLLASSGNIAFVTPSATANFISRSYPANVLNPPPGELYLQTGPGTFANLKIPGLTGMSNRIVHRAQISIEQLPDNSITDSIFSVPTFMYLDLKDTGTTKWKPLYFDLSPNARYDPDFKSGFPYFPASGQIDYSYFGGIARKRTNALGVKVWYYDLNVTRYVQQIITKGEINYELRLFPGFTTVYPQYGTTANPAAVISLNNPLAQGRIRVKSGNFPDPEKKVKMRLTMVWSKI